MTINYEILPAHMQDGMRRYIEDRIPPGGFLTAVLANDFVDAIGKADAVNGHRLADYARFLTWELPARSYPGSPWGSYEAVQNWLTPTKEVANDEPN